MQAPAFPFRCAEHRFALISAPDAFPRAASRNRRK
jgi:hypothetical protein